MTKHNFFRYSQCLGTWLHRFDITEELPTGVKEVCQICKKQIFTKIIDDKVNNLSYMDSHIRLSLPKIHPYYFHEHEFDAYESGILSPIQI